MTDEKNGKATAAGSPAAEEATGAAEPRCTCKDINMATPEAMCAYCWQRLIEAEKKR